jgi:cation diffusion facilitator family transporter
MEAASIDVARTGVRRVLWITLGLNVLVSGAKILVGKLSGSLAMTADGYHSLLDGTNNVVGLVVTTFAYAPPDEGHPYGHRKFETAATLGIGIAMLSLAYGVFTQAVGPHQPRPEITPLNWTVMLVTLAVNVFVARYETREGQRLGSAYLIADAAHTRSDVLVTLGVLGSFVGTAAGVPWIDRAVAGAIALFVAILAGRILVGSFHSLTDRAMLPVAELVDVVRAVPGVRLCRDLRTRGIPNAVYVDLVVHVDGDMTLRAAHDVADEIERALTKAHPEIVDVVVHLEPAERRARSEAAREGERRS